MRPIDEVRAVRPADAVELRLVRRFPRVGVARAAGSWIADAVWGTDDGPSDERAVPRAAEIHWLTASGVTIPIVLADDEAVGADDVAVLVTEARRAGVRFAVWSESGPVGRPSMTLTAAFFTQQPPSRLDEAVVVDRSTGDTTVRVTERQPRQVWFLVMIPVLVLSFAWVFFLIVGGLPKMLRDIWERGVTGVSQETVADLGDGRLRVRSQRGARMLDEVDLPRASVAAIASFNGLTACTDTGAVALPIQWATSDLGRQRALTDSFATAINIELGAV